MRHHATYTRLSQQDVHTADLPCWSASFSTGELESSRLGTPGPIIVCIIFQCVIRCSGLCFLHETVTVELKTDLFWHMCGSACTANSCHGLLDLYHERTPKWAWRFSSQNYWGCTTSCAHRWGCDLSSWFLCSWVHSLQPSHHFRYGCNISEAILLNQGMGAEQGFESILEQPLKSPLEVKLQIWENRVWCQNFHRHLTSFPVCTQVHTIHCICLQKKNKVSGR